MKRYDIFHIIHKGLKASLYQTALQLQHTDFTVAEETEEALNRVKEVVMLFEGHAHKEDKFVFSAISAFEPSVVSMFESEHEADIQLGEQLKRSIDKVTASPSPAEKIRTGKDLSESFVAFMVFNLLHMAKEEEIINKILWRYYPDEEIKKINTQIRQDTPAWMQDFYITWMLRGINNTEAVTWMQAVEKEMPPIAFQTLLQKAKQELPVRRFRKVSQSFKESLQPEPIL